MNTVTNLVDAFKEDISSQEQKIGSKAENNKDVIDKEMPVLADFLLSKVSLDHFLKNV